MPDYLKPIFTASAIFALLASMLSAPLYATPTVPQNGSEQRSSEPASKDAKNVRDTRPEAVQEIIEEARARCRALRGAFSMPVSAVRDDLDLNNDSNPDYLVDGTAFQCDRGNSRSFQTSPRRASQYITLIMSDEGQGHTVHQFNTSAYDLIRLKGEDVIILHELRENCSRRRTSHSRTRYRQNEAEKPGCYRALVWRDGIFATAR